MKKIQKNDGFTLIELLIVVAIIGIIAAIAVPGLLRARMSGNEASAIGSVRTIGSAQAAFAASCGGGGYAEDLVALATVAGTAPGAVGFIPKELGTAPYQKSGYKFASIKSGAAEILAAAATCNGAKSSWPGYMATGDPIESGTTGVRYFATNQTGTIKFDNATIADFEAATAKNLQ